MSDDEHYCPIKHYKLALDPECDTRQISEKRKRVWEKAFQKLSEGNPSTDFILLRVVFEHKKTSINFLGFYEFVLYHFFTIN